MAGDDPETCPECGAYLSTFGECPFCSEDSTEVVEGSYPTEWTDSVPSGVTPIDPADREAVRRVIDSHLSW